jgi:hypothetical protein
MWHEQDRRQNCARFWWESTEERDLFEDQGMDGRMGSEWILGRLAGRLSGFNWLKTGASGGLVNVVMNLWILVSHS